MKATIKQRKLMKNLGIETDDLMSREEAQDLITMELDSRSQLEDYDHNPFLDESDVPIFDARYNSDDWNY